eukprot:Sspe_Gene.64189::Locus_37646_Transcript_1_1_Confidence_1.000_Length_1812::g.64189::m.64189
MDHPLSTTHPLINLAIHQYLPALRHISDFHETLSKRPPPTPVPTLRLTLSSPVPLAPLAPALTRQLHHILHTNPSTLRITISQQPKRKFHHALDSSRKVQKHDPHSHAPTTPQGEPCPCQQVTLPPTAGPSIHKTHVIVPIDTSTPLTLPQNRLPFTARDNITSIQKLPLTEEQKQKIQEVLQTTLHPHLDSDAITHFNHLLRTARTHPQLLFTTIDRSDQWWLVCPHHVSSLSTTAFGPPRYHPTTQEKAKTHTTTAHLPSIPKAFISIKRSNPDRARPI